MDPMIILLVVVVMGLIGAVAFVFLGGGTGKGTASRLDVMVGKKRGSDSAPEILLKKTLFEGDKNALLAALTGMIPNLQKFFEQADCAIKPTTLILTGVVLGVLAMATCMIMGMGAIVAFLAALPWSMLPLMWVWNKRRVRLKKFASQLPDALELVARALRAGHALGAGMHVVAEEMPAPIAEEFGRVYEEQNLGISVEDSMRSMAERVPNLDLKFFVTSVAIQRQTGGDLAEILDKIGYVIRERYRILGQIKALTGEGRLSGVVLIGLPFVLLLFMMYTKYDYVSDLWNTKKSDLGPKMLWGAGIMQVIGTLWIKKIVNIKV